MFLFALRITPAYPCKRLNGGYKDDKAYCEIPNWVVFFYKPREKQINIQLNEN